MERLTQWVPSDDETFSVDRHPTVRTPLTDATDRLGIDIDSLSAWFKLSSYPIIKLSNDRLYLIQVNPNCLNFAHETNVSDSVALNKIDVRF